MRSSKFKSFFSIFCVFVLLVATTSGDAFSLSVSNNANNLNVKGKITDIGNSLLQSFLDENLDSTNSNSSTKNENNTKTKVYVGGFPIGIKLYCDGVIVVDTQDVETSSGYQNPSQNAGLVKGDIIKAINGEKVTQNSEVSKIIEKSNGTPLELTILRNGKEKKLTFSSVYSSVSGQYKAGLWIRDSSAGIGTVTFVTENGAFAALGHAVCDIDTGDIMPLSYGETTKAEITGYYKGTKGTAGELCGVLESGKTGKIILNESIGIYGVFENVDKNKTLYELANKNEIEIGQAKIITTVENGKREEFNIEIERIDYASTDNKNLIIKVVDENLISKTGGIIQGMSGSPIIQNGKLIGAVTHVFLNDPTGGYGIFAETMLEKTGDLVTS